VKFEVNSELLQNVAHDTRWLIKWTICVSFQNGMNPWNPQATMALLWHLSPTPISVNVDHLQAGRRGYTNLWLAGP